MFSCVKYRNAIVFGVIALLTFGFFVYLLTSHAKPALRHSSPGAHTLGAIEMVTHAHRTSASQRRSKQAIDAKLAVLASRSEHPRIQALRKSIVAMSVPDSASVSDHEGDEHADTAHHENTQHEESATTPTKSSAATTLVTPPPASSPSKSEQLSEAHVQAAAELVAAAGLSAADLEELPEYTFSTFGFVPSETNSMSSVSNVDTLPESTNTHTDSSQPRTLRGHLAHKAWSMTEQSYVAGGSDYFTLELDGPGDATEEIILRVDHLKPPSAESLGLPQGTSADTVVKHMNNFLTQLAAPPASHAASATANLVEIEGYDRMESTTHPTSELEPHPMGYEDSITTHTFVIKSVRSLGQPPIQYNPQSLQQAQHAASRPNVVGNSDLKPTAGNLQSVEVPVTATGSGNTIVPRAGRFRPDQP